MQIQQHELARVEMESMVKQWRVHGAAERHELRFNASEMRKRAHRVEHFLKQSPAQSFLRKLAGDIQAADEPFLLFKDVEGIARRCAALECHAAGERARFHKSFD